MTEDVRADANRAAAGRVNVHLREVVAAKRCLRRNLLFRRNLQFGREYVRPVRENLQRERLEIFRAVVPVRRQPIIAAIIVMVVLTAA